MTDIPEQELPGMWSHSDFEGGDPDTRSYAQRARDAEAAGDTKTADFWRAKIAGDAPVNPAEWPKTMEQLNAVWHEGHKAGYEQAIREIQSATAEEAKSPYDITAQQHNINVARRQPGGL